MKSAPPCTMFLDFGLPAVQTFATIRSIREWIEGISRARRLIRLHTMDQAEVAGRIFGLAWLVPACLVCRKASL